MTKKLMQKSLIFIVIFLFINIPNIFGQGLVVDKEVIEAAASRMPKRSKQVEYENMLNSVEAQANFDSSFWVVDSSGNNYYPCPEAKTVQWDWFPMTRIIGKKGDSSYVIGLYAYPGMVFGHSLLKGSLGSWVEDKSKFSILSPLQLHKLNCDSGYGKIFNVKVSIPLKGKYSKCKAVAFEDSKFNYVTMYYFYKDKLSEKEILAIINSQLGIISFKNEKR